VVFGVVVTARSGAGMARANRRYHGSNSAAAQQKTFSCCIIET